jgi:hypothetical protein
MHLKEISFPIYELRYPYPPSTEGKVSFYTRKYQDKIVVEIVDDKDIPNPSLSVRRLNLAVDKVNLHELKRAVFFVGDLIKLSTPKKWFIDSSGKVFQYTKSKLVPLIFRNIQSTTRVPGATLIYVEGMPFAFKSLYPPTSDEKCAGLLQLSTNSYILYGFFTERHKDCKRKI